MATVTAVVVPVSYVQETLSSSHQILSANPSPPPANPGARYETIPDQILGLTLVLDAEPENFNTTAFRFDFADAMSVLPEQVRDRIRTQTQAHSHMWSTSCRRYSYRSPLEA